METNLSSLTVQCGEENYVVAAPVYINLTAFGVTHQFDVSAPFLLPEDPATLSPATLSAETTSESNDAVTTPDPAPDGDDEVETESGRSTFQPTQRSEAKTFLATFTPLPPKATGMVVEPTLKNATQDYEAEDDTGVVNVHHEPSPQLFLVCYASSFLFVLLCILIVRRLLFCRIRRRSATARSLDIHSASASELLDIATARGWQPLVANANELRAQQRRLRRTSGPAVNVDPRDGESSMVLATVVEMHSGHQDEGGGRKKEEEKALHVDEYPKGIRRQFVLSSGDLEAVEMAKQKEREGDVLTEEEEELMTSSV